MKLVRDKIPELFPDAGSYLRAHSTELDMFLFAKAVEELSEVMQAEPEELAGEIADLVEVLVAIAQRAGVTPEDIGAARAAKRAERGLFREGWVLS